MSKLRKRLRSFYRHVKRSRRSVWFNKNGTMLH